MNRILTIDLESDFETAQTKSFELIAQLLDLLDDYDAKATFFVVGNLIKGREAIIKEISRKGHEIGSHSWSHSYLTKLNVQQLEEEIVKTKEALKKLKIPCVGFRAPYFLPHEHQFPLLKEHGFLYDSSYSSVFPGRYFRPHLSSKPHMAQGLQALPMPNFLFKSVPAGLSYYRLFHPLSKTFPLPYMIYLHPCELLGEMPKNGISPIVRKSYGRNLTRSWQLFEELLSKNEGKWVSCKEYVRM